MSLSRLRLHFPAIYFFLICSVCILFCKSFANYFRNSKISKSPSAEMYSLVTLLLKFQVIYWLHPRAEDSECIYSKLELFGWFSAQYLTNICALFILLSVFICSTVNDHTWSFGQLKERAFSTTLHFVLHFKLCYVSGGRYHVFNWVCCNCICNL